LFGDNFYISFEDLYSLCTDSYLFMFISSDL